MKFIIYIFFRLHKHYYEENNPNKSITSAFIAIVGLFLVNVISLVLLISSFFELSLVERFLSFPYLTRGVFLFGLVVSFNLIFYLLWKAQKNKLMYLFESIEKMKNEQIKQYKLGFCIYLIFTALFLLFSILSGALFK